MTKKKLMMLWKQWKNLKDSKFLAKYYETFISSSRKVTLSAKLNTISKNTTKR